MLCDKTGTITKNELVFRAFATENLIFEGSAEDILKTCA